MIRVRAVRRHEFQMIQAISASNKLMPGGNNSDSISEFINECVVMVINLLSDDRFIALFEISHAVAVVAVALAALSLPIRR
jgi:hypothetical protein